MNYLLLPQLEELAYTYLKTNYGLKKQVQYILLPREIISYKLFESLLAKSPTTRIEFSENDSQREKQLQMDMNIM